MPIIRDMPLNIEGCRLKAQNCRLRSANRGNANNAWNVNSTGNANNNNATNANRPAPECVNKNRIILMHSVSSVQRERKEPNPLPFGKTIEP